MTPGSGSRTLSDPVSVQQPGWSRRPGSDHPPAVKFYELLGMKVINKIEQPEAKFDLYFLGYDAPQALYHGSNFSSREGLIEVQCWTSEVRRT